MMNKLTSVAFHPAMLALLIPLTGGCAFHAQGAIRAPSVSVVASVPRPPSVTITASAPAPATTTVAVRPPTVTSSVATVPYADDGIELGEGQSVYNVSVSAAPPPPPSGVVVVTPPSRSGHVWVGAHYAWSGGRWVWTAGQWITARVGFTWVQPHYNASSRVFVRGHWESRQLSDRHVRPAPSPATNVSGHGSTAAPAPPESNASASSSARVSVGFRAEASATAGSR